MMPGSPTGHPSFRKSFHFAIQGLREALRTERNLKVMIFIALLAIICGLIIGLDYVGWLAVLICCGVVLSAELINTAIETSIDLVSPEFHPLAGRAKDIAAAAVWVASCMAAIVGLIVFITALLGK